MCKLRPGYHHGTLLLAEEHNLGRLQVLPEVRAESFPGVLFEVLLEVRAKVRAESILEGLLGAHLESHLPLEFLIEFPLKSPLDCPRSHLQQALDTLNYPDDHFDFLPLPFPPLRRCLEDSVAHYHSMQMFLIQLLRPRSQLEEWRQASLEQFLLQPALRYRIH